MRRAVRFELALFVAGFVLACSDGAAPPDPGPPAVGSVTVTAVRDSVQVGDTLRLVVVVKDATGATLTDRTVTFTSADAARATVSSAGLVTGVGPSSGVLLTATSEGVSGTFTMKVTEYWTIEAGQRGTGNAVSVIVLSDGTYRMYHPGLAYSTSPDGLTFSARTAITSITGEPGEILRNPSVVRLANGTFVMMYEGVKDETLPTKVARIYRATSSDGITFTKTVGAGTSGAVLEGTASESNFVGAPDVAVLSTGVMRLYFNSGPASGFGTAVSSDNGVTWTREGAVTIAGLESARNPADADIVVRSDGSYRIFFAAPPNVAGGNPRLYSARGTDGKAFTLESGERSGDAQMWRVDPESVLLSNGKYRVYFSESSNNGATFTVRSAVTP